MALIGTTEEIMRFVAVQQNTDFMALLPGIEEAEDLYLRSLLGEELFIDLRDKYESGEELEERYTKLLPFVQRPLSQLGFVCALPMLNLAISSSGAMQPGGKDAAPASQWRVREAREAMQRSGYIALDRMLEYLEKHTSDFPSWKDSEGYTERREFFLSSAAEFSRYYSIRRSRRTFLLLAGIMRKTETLQIQGVLGSAYFTALKARISGAEALTADDGMILPLVRSALAHLTMASALLEMAVEVSEAGVTVQGLRAINENSEEKGTASEGLIDQLRTAAENTGKSFLAQLETYLNANASATRYPEYFADTIYKAPGTDTGATFTNTTTNKIYRG